ncbi:hypothetical protein ACMD2_14642, partial [Ananas comosus]
MKRAKEKGVSLDPAAEGEAVADGEVADLDAGVGGERRVELQHEAAVVGQDSGACAAGGDGIGVGRHRAAPQSVVVADHAAGPHQPHQPLVVVQVVVLVRVHKREVERPAVEHGQRGALPEVDLVRDASLLDHREPYLVVLPLDIHSQYLQNVGVPDYWVIHVEGLGFRMVLVAALVYRSSSGAKQTPGGVKNDYLAVVRQRKGSGQKGVAGVHADLQLSAACPVAALRPGRSTCNAYACTSISTVIAPLVGRLIQKYENASERLYTQWLLVGGVAELLHALMLARVHARLEQILYYFIASEKNKKIRDRKRDRERENLIEGFTTEVARSFEKGRDVLQA